MLYTWISRLQRRLMESYPFVGEIVHCELEERNAHDPFAVVLKKAGIGTVGHQ